MTEASGQERDVFPDQGEKLTYLIRERGDQRTPSPQNRGIALGERVIRNGANYLSPIVRSQAQLAEALGLHASTVTRWKKQEQRIPLEDLTEICRIFAVDEAAFKEMGLAAFREAYRASASASAKADWRLTLRQNAMADVGRITLRNPFAIGEMRYAGVPNEDAAQERLPEVPAGSPFWMEFASPVGANPNAPRWVGWHVLLFNHDVAKQGFRCLLPAYGQHTAFATTRFPAKRVLELPRKPVLTHPESDVGDFEMVLVVSHEAFPEAVLEPLIDVNAHGLAIEETLRHLAEWLTPRLTQMRAAIAKAPYRVMAVSTSQQTPPPA